MRHYERPVETFEEVYQVPAEDETAYVVFEGGRGDGEFGGETFGPFVGLGFVGGDEEGELFEEVEV